MRVEIDPSASPCVSSIGQVQGALRSDNAVVPGGGVDVGSRRFNIEAGGHFETVEEVRDTVLAADGARIATLGDVASVGWGTAEETHRARVDGRRAVFVTLEQKPNQIVFEVRDRARAVIEEFRTTLPPDVQLDSFRPSTSRSRSRTA